MIENYPLPPEAASILWWYLKSIFIKLHRMAALDTKWLTRGQQNNIHYTCNTYREMENNKDISFHSQYRVWKFTKDRNFVFLLSGHASDFFLWLNLLMHSRFSVNINSLLSASSWMWVFECNLTFFFGQQDFPLNEIN